MLIRFLDGTSREVANLRGANLSDAKLRGADLRGVNLCFADLRGANLYDVNLRDANLCGVNLRDADLRRANLCCADLRDANLCGVNLCDADLSCTNLCGVNLRCADLYGADLRGANLCAAELYGARGLEQFCILPAGDLVGYKKLANGTIAVLRIPADARRVNAYTSRKCRAEFAYVTEGNGRAQHDGTPYVKGTCITPYEYDPDPRVECSHGIHFFITREEAEAY
jgi:uncharacterized protein YjbI with pentapeptide repeats